MRYAITKMLTTTLTTILTTFLTITLTSNLDYQPWLPTLTINLDYQPWLTTMTTNHDCQYQAFDKISKTLLTDLCRWWVIGCMDGMYGVSSFSPLNFLSEQKPDPYLCRHYGYSSTAGSSIVGDSNQIPNKSYSVRSSAQTCPTWTTTKCLPGNPCKTALGTKDPLAFCSYENEHEYCCCGRCSFGITLDCYPNPSSTTGAGILRPRDPDN